MASPYRTPAEQPRVVPDDEPVFSGQIVPYLAVLWLASIARVAFAFHRAETISDELLVAVVVVGLLPYLSRGEICDYRAARRRPKE